MLGWDRLRFFTKHVIPKERLGSIRAAVLPCYLSPHHTKDLSGMCNTFLISAEVDPLRDEAEAYGFKLVQAGNKIQMKR